PREYPPATGPASAVLAPVPPACAVSEPIDDRDLIAPIDPMPRYVLYCLPATKISSPGDSSTPASNDPSMTVSAPTAMALAMSPEYCRPPSPISGIPAG